MCNKIKCAIQYTVDLINNNINRDVQTGCTHSSGLWRIMNVIKCSQVDVMRLSLSLGAWWPEGRSSSSVSQFLPSCS